MHARGTDSAPLPRAAGGIVSSTICCLTLALFAACAYRHILLDPSSLGLDPARYPPWGYLWDDDKNYRDNGRVTSGLSREGAAWAWTTDAVIWGVYEPASLILKMALHSAMDFDARTYRLVNLWGHVANACLAFLAGRAVVAGACDDDYLEARLEREIAGEERRLEEEEAEREGDDGARSAAADAAGGRRRDATNGPQRRRRGAGDAAASRNPNAEPDPSGEENGSLLRRRRLEALRRSVAAAGCLLGAAVFTVHPLQVQTVGWASCMSYVFSTFFCLLSMWCWVRHRGWGRDRRRNGRAEMASGGGEAPRASRKAIARTIGAARRARSSSWLYEVSAWQGLSVACYILACLCKAPAVTLPLVLVIMDVYLYTAPLSVHPMGDDIMKDGLGHVNGRYNFSGHAGVEKASKNRAKKSATPLSASVTGGGAETSSQWPPRRLFTSTIPALVRLTVRALPSHLPHLFCIAPLFYMHASHNAPAESRGTVPTGERATRALWALGWYATKLVLPADLAAAVHYEGWGLNDRWEIAACAVLVPLATAAVLEASVRSAWGRVLACGWGCTVALLLPGLGIVRHSRLVVADRYMYMPLAIAAPMLGAIAGACCTLNIPGVSDCAAFALAGGALPECTLVADRASFDASLVDSFASTREKASSSSVSGNWKQKGARGGTTKRWACVCFLASALCGVTLSVVHLIPYNLRHWRNEELMWLHSIELFPSFESAHTNLVGMYKKKGDLDKALYHARHAAEIRPDVTKYTYNLVLMMSFQERWDEVVSLLTDRLQTISNNDHYANNLHYYMGISHYWMGE